MVVFLALAWSYKGSILIPSALKRKIEPYLFVDVNSPSDLTLSDNQFVFPISFFCC